MNEEQLLPFLHFMVKFAELENAAARKKWGLTMSSSRHADCVESSRLGGKRWAEIDPLELSPHAEKVKNYLQKNLTHSEIATLLGCTRQAVGDTMRRYGLRRKQLSRSRVKNDNKFQK